MPRIWGRRATTPAPLSCTTRLLKANPKDVKLLDKKAIVLTRLKRYPESIAIREKIVDAQPEVYQGYADLSNLYTLENRPEAFRQWLGSRVEKDPGNLPAMAALVDAYAQQKMDDEGWKLVRGIVQKHKGDPEVQQTFVNVLSQHNRMEEAIGVQREMAQSRPNDLDAHIKLADLLAGSGNPGESNKCFCPWATTPTCPLRYGQQARRVLAQRLERSGQTGRRDSAVQSRRESGTGRFDLHVRARTPAWRKRDTIRKPSPFTPNMPEEAKTPAAPFRAYYLVRDWAAFTRSRGIRTRRLRQYREAQRAYPQNDEVGVAIQRLTQAKPDNAKPPIPNAED